MSTYIHKVSGDEYTLEDAVELLEECICIEEDEVFGMTIQEALKHAFVEVE